MSLVEGVQHADDDEHTEVSAHYFLALFFTAKGFGINFGNSPMSTVPKKNQLKLPWQRSSPLPTTSLCI